MPVESTVVSKVMETKGGRPNSLINLTHVVISKDFISKDQPGGGKTPKTSYARGSTKWRGEQGEYAEECSVRGEHTSRRLPQRLWRLGCCTKVDPLLARTRI